MECWDIPTLHYEYHIFSNTQYLLVTSMEDIVHTDFLAELLRPKDVVIKPTNLGTASQQPLLRANDPAFNITYSFRNTTMWDVVITDQLNASWEVKASPSTMDEGYIEIRLHYDVRDPRVSLLNINLDSGDNSETLNSIIDHFKDRGIHDRYKITKDSIILSYKVYARDLQRSDGSIHIPEIGYCVTIRNIILNKLPINPSSLLGKDIAKTIDDKVRGFHYKVIIVDPLLKMGDMYINIGEVVSKVKVNTSNEIEGIYVSRSVDISIDNPTGYQTIRYGLDDYEKIPLFPSPALAKSHGDIVSRLKEQHELSIQEMKNANEKLKLDTENLKITNAQRLQDLEESLKQEQLNQARLKTKLEEVKTEKDKELMAYKHQLEIQKHQMDMSSYERKDSLELIKWIPAMVVGIGAVAIALKK